jgi:hypothetical protein
LQRASHHSQAFAHRLWQESKFKEALRWSVNILKLEPSNAIMSEYQVTYAAQHAALYHGRETMPPSPSLPPPHPHPLALQPLLAALAVRSTMKAQSSSDDGSGQSDSGSDSSSSESESSSGSESDSDGEGEGDKENVDAVQTKLQGMSVKPLPGS